MVWSPLAQGVLTGKYKKGAQPPKGSRATTNSNPFIHQHLTDEKLVKVEQLTKLAAELGITTAQLALGVDIERAKHFEHHRWCQTALSK